VKIRRIKSLLQEDGKGSGGNRERVEKKKKGEKRDSLPFLLHLSSSPRPFYTSSLYTFTA
jgi:hypothetical protein